MASGIPVERYTDVLDTALAKMRPLGELLAKVLTEGPGQADAAELNLLAFHSWDQDAMIELSDDEKLEAFATLYEHTPAALAVERSRFLCLYLQQASRVHEAAGEEPDEAKAPVLPAEARGRLQASLLEVLQDRELRNANLFFLFYRAGKTVDLLHPEPSANRDALIQEWDAAARACEDDEALSLNDRMTALLPRVELARLPAGAPVAGEAADDAAPPLPEELLDHLRGRIVWANEAVEEGGELQAVMSTMASILRRASLLQEAEALLVERMNDAAAPHYYMSLLGTIKEEADLPAEALAWFRRAYDSAEGPHTRFQWGSSYLRKAMELAPDRAETIEAAALEVLEELLLQDDAFANRNHRRLVALQSAFEEWSEGGEDQAVIDRIRSVVHNGCDRFPGGDEDSQKARCLSFLAGEEG
jgi:protein disulfide-isomerase